MTKSLFIKILITLLIIIVLSIIMYLFLGDKITKDEKTFKTEYENLNDKKNDKNKEYVKVTIPSDNNVKYADFDKTMNFLDKGTGILYLGFPECPWCRNMVSVLIDVAKENEVEDVYYYNALAIRDIRELDEKGNIITTKEGTKEYYKLVDKLNDYIGPYEGLNDDSIKRIYFPTVVFVMGGKIVGTHIGTLDSQTDPYKVLDNKQKKELKKIYQGYIDKIFGVCDDAC